MTNKTTNNKETKHLTKFASKVLGGMLLTSAVMWGAEPTNKSVRESGTAHVETFYGEGETTMFVSQSNCSVRQMILTLRFSQTETTSKLLELPVESCGKALRTTFVHAPKQVIHLEMLEVETNTAHGMNP